MFTNFKSITKAADYFFKSMAHLYRKEGIFKYRNANRVMVLIFNHELAQVCHSSGYFLKISFILLLNRIFSNAMSISRRHLNINYCMTGWERVCLSTTRPTYGGNAENYWPLPSIRQFSQNLCPFLTRSPIFWWNVWPIVWT